MVILAELMFPWLKSCPAQPLRVFSLQIFCPLKHPILVRDITSDSGHVIPLVKIPVTSHLRIKAKVFINSLPRPWSLVAMTLSDLISFLSLPCLLPSWNIPIPLSSQALCTHHCLCLECSDSCKFSPSFSSAFCSN